MRVYLDWNAAAPLRPEAARALGEAALSAGNPSSPHREGQRARDLVEQARQQLAELVAVPASELLLCGSATEALNLALWGRRHAWLRAGRRRLLVSAVEHAALLEPARRLAESGFELELLPVEPSGRLRRSRLEQLLDDDVACVALMHANNETGVLFPLEQLAGLVHAAGAELLVDAAQTVGRIPVERDRLGADLLAFSSTKLGGPAGAGALVLRQGLELDPLILGGPQERGRRAGTEPLPSLCGFGAAARAARAALASEAAHVLALREQLERGLSALEPQAVFHGGGAERVPGTVSVCLPGCDAEALVLQLDLLGVACSTGAACASGAAEPSHVLRAMGCPPSQLGSSLRLSLGPALDAEAIDLALARLAQALDGQRRAGVRDDGVAS